MTSNVQFGTATSQNILLSSMYSMSRETTRSNQDHINQASGISPVNWTSQLGSSQATENLYDDFSFPVHPSIAPAYTVNPSFAGAQSGIWGVHGAAGPDGFASGTVIGGGVPPSYNTSQDIEGTEKGQCKALSIASYDLGGVESSASINTLSSKRVPHTEDVQQRGHGKSCNGTFTCGWNGCKYKGTFQRTEDLIRHVRSIHVQANSYPCPVEGCHRPFNRKDNLDMHIRRRHDKNVKGFPAHPQCQK
uniref:C2H2-type domain-containing protein n=1 Tax=Coccidioides posadasii RMSCC 3488 TaxID=454284 RepID=A0A0J6FDT4_COCPO|nr:hypothetical protein CPAG_04795 [Coccidioides posadasii RMSCC 3488]